MSGELKRAIVRRVRGTETLTGRAAAAQSELASLLQTTPSGAPAIRNGAKGSSAYFPEVTFREDAGPEALGGPDVGIVTHSIFRFEIWDNGRDGATSDRIADCLEQLFDRRRDAPVITLQNDHRCYWSDLLTGLQGPFHDDIKNAFVSLIAFRFTEARP